MNTAEMKTFMVEKYNACVELSDSVNTIGREDRKIQKRGRCLNHALIALLDEIGVSDSDLNTDAYGTWEQVKSSIGSVFGGQIGIMNAMIEAEWNNERIIDFFSSIKDWNRAQILDFITRAREALSQEALSKNTE